MSKQIGILVITTISAIVFVLSWSSGFVIAAVATAETSPLTLLVWRFGPLALILLAVVAATGAGRGLRPAAVRDQALVGLFAQFGYCAAVYGAVAVGVATGTVALIDAVQPLLVAVLVGPVLGLRVRGAQWIGLLVGAAGALLVVWSQFGSLAAPPTAFLLPAAAMACLIVGTLLERRTPHHPGVLVTLTVHVTVTAVVLVVIGAATGTLAPPASPSFWTAVVLTALFPTLLAYGLYWWLLRRAGITVLNTLLFLIAPTTAVAGAILLAEPLTALTLVGFVVCGAGVAVVLLNEPRRAPAPGAAESARNVALQPD